ncbi:MAG: type IV pilus assembly protein PilM [Parcubacteria group bacterium]|nr:type IV pilus assembly protein PilM [Parcubacteria group bacterium]
MVWPFQKKQKIGLGIDIGTSSIKIVQLRRNGEAIELVTYGNLYRTSDDPARTNFSKVLDGEAARMVQFIVKQANALPSSATMSIPVLSSFVTLIDMPNLSPEEIAKAIPFEARQYVPVPLSEVALDWSIVKLDTLKDVLTKKTRTQVVLVAIPKDIIEQYHRIAALAKISVTALEMESFSLVRAVARGEKLPFCIVDIGARSSSVTVVDEGTIRSTHSLESAGNDLTRALTKGMNISWDRAEALKRETGLTGTSGQNLTGELLRSNLNHMTHEISRIIQLYAERTQRTIENIVLTGGSALMPGMTDFLTQTLHTSVSISNPFARMTAPPQLKQALQEIGPSFAVSIGLALHTLEAAE